MKPYFAGFYDLGTVMLYLLSNALIMKTKVLIISQNNLKIEFWEKFINTDFTAISKFENTDLALLNMDLINPYVIIVDHYFSGDDNDNWIKTVVDRITQNGYNKTIFCLSPLYACHSNKHSISSISYNNFNGDFTERLNFSLGHSFKNTNKIYKS